MECYLDNSATTRVFPETAELMMNIMTEDYGNPSSMHHKGVVAESHVRDAKEKIAKTLRCKASEILFTSGGTESDNLALIGGARAYQRQGKHLITTKIEHPAILETMKYLESEGFEVTYLPVDREGRVQLSDLEAAIRPDTILVSVMLVNNEIGALEPFEEIGACIKKCNPKCLFHVDAVQGYGKFRITPKTAKIDLMSVSSHKIHGPKGVGFLYVRDGVRLVPICYGGGQQKGLRSGTENVPGIAGMAASAERMYATLEEDDARLRELKDLLIQEVTTKLPDIQVNGRTDAVSAPHIVSLSISGVRAEVLLHALEGEQVYVSAGSACASNHPHTSETLKAIGLDANLLDSTIRISLSVMTTREDILQCAAALEKYVPVLRAYHRS